MAKDAFSGTGPCLADGKVDRHWVKTLTTGSTLGRLQVSDDDDDDDDDDELVVVVVVVVGYFIDVVQCIVCKGHHHFQNEIR